MGEIKDDPREVLALLNSLGFVGITAPQLKSFMKDLKMYRKIKERERQIRKEEMKKKILKKQQTMLRDILNENKLELQKTKHENSSDCTNLYNDSIVEVKIKCIPKDRKDHEHNYTEEVDHRKPIKQNTEYNENNIHSRRIRKSSLAYTRANDKTSDRCSRYKENSNVCPKPVENTQRLTTERQECNIIKKKVDSTAAVISPTKESRLHTARSVSKSPKRPTSAPDLSGQRQKLKHASSDRSGSMSNLSTLPTRASSQSGRKSFIRPWHLQQDARKGSTGVKKCDPVALYQKYQQQWKQISFPGEEKHASVRWAVRERMLGGDPHSMPHPRKSTSMPVLKRK